MITREAVSNNRTFLFCLLLCITVTITGACAAAASLAQPVTAPSSPPSAMLTPPNQEVLGISTEVVEIIPATGLEHLSITGCPDWDVNKMYEYGEYLYGFYCAGCHGRQGQGVPFTGHFPPLNDSTLAVSEDISHSLLYMMNTDIHPNATMLFEKDALAVINYIRITFASNTDLICPGEYTIEINP
jgi:hypothetical protein